METKVQFEKVKESFLQLSKVYFSEKSHNMVQEALQLADEKLQGIFRYDGSPFLIHSINLANIIIQEIGLGSHSVVSSLLHDVVRLHLITLNEVELRFGKACSIILKDLCNISDVETKESEAQADNFRELILSYSTNPRVILIKLADRLEVMRTLDIFPPEKRAKKSWESLHLYAPIAHKLGLYNIKSELEDCALKYLEPTDYTSISQQLAASAEEREQFIQSFTLPIEEKMRKQGIKYTLKSRTKSIYSIWKKMKRTKVSFAEVYDLFAIRIIVDCPLELEKALCWNVYSIATDFYTPNPNRMRDWISIPKANGYESLHSTVVTKTGRWVEIQIRSERMNEVAERGVAAHWRYKGIKGEGLSTEKWLGILHDLKDTVESHDETIQELDDKHTSAEIFVFTPNGDLRKLCQDATVLDFAFEIHTNLGSTCTGAKVNQLNVSIKERLKNGDIVQILTSKNQKPKADWLTFATTSKARNRIKAYLREEEAKSTSLIREELERKFKNWKFSITMEEAIPLLCKLLKVKSGTELYQQIDLQKISFALLKELLTKHLHPEEKEEKPSRKETHQKKGSESTNSLIIDETLNNIEFKLARCCNPIYGDEVFGFTTINSGITIHRSDCSNALWLKERYPYRILSAHWQETIASGLFSANIRIQADDTMGLVSKITEIITHNLKLNIHSMNLNTSNGNVSGLITLAVSSNKAVDAAIHNLLRIKGMQRVYRVNK